MDTEDNLMNYDRVAEVEKFYETKAGVKGLVDSGIGKIPKLFIHSSPDLPKDSDSKDHSFEIPTIDLDGVDDGERRKVVVEEVRVASNTWGFFQMINHEIPVSILDEMINGVRRFHEQPTEEKQKIYAQEYSPKPRFYSNGIALRISQHADWRDSLNCNFSDEELDPERLPLVCRDIIIEYVRCIIKLKDTLSKLLSEALGIDADYLSNIGCMKTESWVGHYYPACPEPDKTLGATRHSDPDFLTILLQDEIGGLQVLHQNRWVDVPPTRGALVANIGDLLQLITNDRFKSVEHRVLARPVVPRISVATFFYPKERGSRYGPIKEFSCEDDPPIYRDVSVNEYVDYYKSKGLDGKSGLLHFKL
ncbi:hypothetical protein ACHQM5_014394 [Ranunculus cassubicifolius]